MIMKNKLYMALAALFMISLTSCFEEPGTDILLEASEISIADASEVGGTERRIVVIPDGNEVDLSIDVELIGQASSAGVTVSLEVDTDQSTAIEGVDVNFPNGKDVTIPAGEFRAPLNFTVNDDGLDPDTPLTLVLRIANSSIAINENLNEVSLSLIGICPPDLFDYTTLAGTYTVTSSGESTDGCPANNPIVDLEYGPVTLTLDSETDTEINFTVSEAFGGLYIGWYDDCYGYGFETAQTMVVNKETGAIAIDASSAFTGDDFSITGSVDPCNGNFVYSWTNVFGDTGTNSFVKQ